MTKKYKVMKWLVVFDLLLLAIIYMFCYYNTNMDGLDVCEECVADTKEMLSNMLVFIATQLIFTVLMIWRSYCDNIEVTLNTYMGLSVMSILISGGYIGVFESATHLNHWEDGPQNSLFLLQMNVGIVVSSLMVIVLVAIIILAIWETVLMNKGVVPAYLHKTGYEDKLEDSSINKAFRVVNLCLPLIFAVEVLSMELKSDEPSVFMVLYMFVTPIFTTMCLANIFIRRNKWIVTLITYGVLMFASPRVIYTCMREAVGSAYNEYTNVYLIALGIVSISVAVYVAAKYGIRKNDEK